MENAFLASGGEFVFKKVGSLFDINPTKNYGLTNDDLFREKGTTPVVVNSSINNGIGGYVARKPTETGNMITFSDTTTSDSIFYQPNDFIGYSHVQGIKPKNHHEQWNKHTLHYFVAIFRAATKGLFNYGNKFNRENAREIEVCLPEKNGEIAFDYMERFVQQLRAFLKLSNLTDVNLSKDEENALAQLSGSLNWKEFRLDDLFNIATGRDVIIGNTISGSIPLISHQHENNGISKYIHPLPDRRLFNHETTLSLADRGVFKASTQNQHFHIGTRVKALTFKSGKHSQNVRLFVVAAINKLQILFTAYSENATNKLPDLMIMLPEKDGTPDWEFMALIGRAIEKCVIADVVAFNEREMAAYEQVI